jgi:hypothetical protein
LEFVGVIRVEHIFADVGSGSYMCMILLIENTYFNNNIPLKAFNLPIIHLSKNLNLKCGWISA